MNIFMLVKVALKALTVNKLRSLLTMLGIIIGVGSVVIMLAFGAGAQKEVDKQIQSLGGNVLILFGSSRMSGGARTSAGAVESLTYSDALALEKAVPEIEAAAAYITAAAQIIAGNVNWSSSIYGVDNRYLTARNWELAEGRLFSSSEIRNGKVAIIGETVRKELFGDDTGLGQIIRVKKVPVTVIGVLKPKGQNTMGRDQDDFLMMPLNTVKKRLSGINKARPDAVRGMSIKVYDGYDMKVVEDTIAETLRARKKIGPNQQDSFRIRNLSEMVETRSKAMSVFNGLLAAVASVSLLVGGIGIMNIMLVSVTERTREIGLRMAVGAEPRDILRQYLVEAVTLCGLGGFIGLLFAVSTTVGLSTIMGWPYVLQINVMVLSLVFSAAIGIFFGFYPAKKASQLQPIEALRFE